MIRLFNNLTIGSLAMFPGLPTRARLVFAFVSHVLWGAVAGVLLMNGWWFIGSLLTATSLAAALFGVRIWSDAREDERRINEAPMGRAEVGWYGIRVGCRRCGAPAHILDPNPACPRCGFAGGFADFRPGNDYRPPQSGGDES